MFRNFRFLARVVVAHGGDVVFEWPAYNHLWKQSSVISMINELNMQRAVFHGCQLGLVSVKNWLPIKKPWAFETAIPQIVEAFQPLKCPGDHMHDPYAGWDTNVSGFYTWQMTDKMHECFLERMHEVKIDEADVAIAEIVFLEDLKPELPVAKSFSGVSAAEDVRVEVLRKDSVENATFLDDVNVLDGTDPSLRTVPKLVEVPFRDVIPYGEADTASAPQSVSGDYKFTDVLAICHR